MESFKELRSFPLIKDASDELKFTELLRHIYRRHANVVPVMAKVSRSSASLHCLPVRDDVSCIDLGQDPSGGLRVVDAYS